MKSTILESMIIAVAGIALGTVSNTLRTSGSLDLFKAYFGAVATKQPLVADSRGSENVDEHDDAAADSPYQVITVDEVADIVGDPELMASGLYVLVDARNENVYEEGHIAGALRCYHYELEACIDRVIEAATGVEKVIVYCNGGECEDSKYMCHELIDNFGLPYESVYLFAGGWAAWMEHELPFVEGPE
ncbi:MAG: rhodanese-like domain-containing protein [Phycisphaerae bacterium]